MLNITSHLKNANQTTIGKHFKITKMAKIKKWTIASVDRFVEKMKPSYTAGEDVKWRSHYENSWAVLLNVKHSNVV